MSASRHDLVLVASGLESEGGGRAVVGRLLARAGADYARQRGIAFSVLHLGGEHPPLPGVAVDSFGGDRLALTRALWRRQLTPRRPALLFDLLGPARAQAWLPAPLRSPYGIFLHGVEVWRPLGWSRSRALRGATLLFANSRHTRDAGDGFLPRPSREIAILPLTLEELPPEGPLDEEVLRRAGEGFLLIVGRMQGSERYKGHDPLLEALPEVAGRCPRARLVVAGDGDDRPRLEAKAAALGLGGRVTFTGFVAAATLEELYRRAAAFVMPSRGEGFGLVYLEAMRAGKPCVAARGGAAAEVVEEGVTGLLVDPEDRGELAAALVRLLSDPGLAQALGEAGRRRGRERFGAEAFRRRLFGHLDRLTGR